MHQIHPIITSADIRAHPALINSHQSSNQLENPDSGEPKALQPIRNQKRAVDPNQATTVAEDLTITEDRTIEIAAP